MDAEIGGRVRMKRRIFPLNKPQKVTVTQLSIADATVARFSACGAIWFYDKADGFDATDPIVFEHLESGSLFILVAVYISRICIMRWAN